jgi:hypothetical protein
MRRLWLAALLVNLLLASAGPAVAATATRDVQATPQRPSKSSDTQTVAEGYLELEAGAAHDSDAFDSSVLLRLGLHRRIEFYFGLSPFITRELDRGTEKGIGDAVVGGKVRFFEAEEGSAAMEGFVKIPSASEDKGLGTGELDAGFRFIASRTWGKDHYDFNLGGDFAGATDSGSNEARWTTILTWSRSWRDRWGHYGELFLQFLPADDDEIITTDWGLTYRINPSFVLDAGINVGLSEDASDFQFLVGVTKVLGRAFD